jgi:hypothetical protein
MRVLMTSVIHVSILSAIVPNASGAVGMFVILYQEEIWTPRSRHLPDRRRA